MINVLKFSCIMLFLTGAAAYFGPAPEPFGTWFSVAALLVLIIHTLEVVFCWRYVRRYQGRLITSVLLTLLFGLLHLIPLLREPQPSHA